MRSRTRFSVIFFEYDVSFLKRQIKITKQYQRLLFSHNNYWMLAFNINRDTTVNGLWRSGGRKSILCNKFAFQQNWFNLLLPFFLFFFLVLLLVLLLLLLFTIFFLSSSSFILLFTLPSCSVNCHLHLERNWAKKSYRPNSKDGSSVLWAIENFREDENVQKFVSC